MWSDSQIVLYWLKSTRVAEAIHQHSHPRSKDADIYFQLDVPPYNYNPSDLLARGITANQLKTSSRWKHGPTWLPNRSQWPLWPTTEIVYKSATETSTDGSTANDIVLLQQQGLHRLISPSDFSCLPRRLRVTAYVFRFVQLLQ